MNRETVIALAREVGLWEMLEGYSSEYGSLDAEEDCLPTLERFAALVAAHEREAVLQTTEELRGAEASRNAMFSDGYDYALGHIEEFIGGRK